MLSAVIPPDRSQPAMPVAGQLAHQRSVRPGPLVLGTALLKTPTRAADRDRTVSRRSKPSSRTALMGEQPNPWDRLQPQDATSPHRGAQPAHPLGPPQAPGGAEPTSRGQTIPSIWALGEDQPVIPGVPFIR